MIKKRRERHKHPYLLNEKAKEKKIKKAIPLLEPIDVDLGARKSHSESESKGESKNKGEIEGDAKKEEKIVEQGEQRSKTSDEVYFVLEGGVHEIGGNKLFIVDGESRIGIDFGLSFSVDRLYYERPLSRPPSWNPLPLLQRLKRPLHGGEIYYLPSATVYPGLYRSDLIAMARAEGLELGETGAPYLAALFVSHPHSDHYECITYLNERTKIYSSTLCRAVISASLAASSAFSDKEVISFRRRDRPSPDEILSQLAGKVDSATAHAAARLGNLAEIKELLLKSVRTGRVKEILNKIESGIAGVVASVLRKGEINDKKLQQRIIATLCAAVEEVVRKHFAAPALNGLGLLNERKIDRDWQTFKDEECIAIENFRIVPLEVSHQALGSYVFIVATRKGNIGYISDFRRHGQLAEKSEKAIKEMARAGIKYLLIEFTRARETYNPPLEAVKKKVKDAISRSRGIAIVDVPHSNQWELAFQYEIAKELGKRLCISPRLAHLLAAIDGANDFPKPDDEFIAILKTRGADGSYAATRKWEEAYFSLPNAVTAEYVRVHQRDFILIGGYYDVNKIFGQVSPRPGSIYIRPFRTGRETTEDFEGLDPDLQAERAASLKKMENWLRLHNLYWEERDIYISGHVSSNDVIDAVKEIKPEFVLPIHTENPKYFESLLIDSGIKVILPKRGEKYYL